MWLTRPKPNSFSESLCCSIGRALALAQSFEDNCKYMHDIANLAANIKSNPTKTLDEILNDDDPEKIIRWLSLGTAINTLKTKHKIDKKIVELLQEGNRARNYIAHKSADPIILGSLTNITDLNEYKAKVFSLAKAEAIIGSLCYQIDEKEYPSFFSHETFTNETTKWILEPIKRYEKKTP